MAKSSLERAGRRLILLTLAEVRGDLNVAQKELSKEGGSEYWQTPLTSAIRRLQGILSAAENDQEPAFTEAPSEPTSEPPTD